METLFNQIQEWIAEGISWLGGNIDEDYGQLDMLYRDDEDSDTYPLTFPLVLVDLPEARWDTFGGALGKVQKGSLTVRVRLALDCYDDTHYTSTTAGRAEERAAMVHELHSLLQGRMPEGGTSPLNRTASRMRTMARGIKVYEQEYECHVWEDATR